MPFGLGRFSRWTYEFQLKTLPWSYELAYKTLGAAAPIVWGPVVRLMSLPHPAGGEAQLERERDPTPSCRRTRWRRSCSAGCARSSWLRVPVATYLTDFAVHPLWVHPGVDLHLAVSQVSAETAGKRGGHDNRAAGRSSPSASARSRSGRDEMRRRLGIEAARARGARASPGRGVSATSRRRLARSPPPVPYHPITVCGKDDKLRASLLEDGIGGTVLGWTDEMPALMAASDALVENAGGLTAMEAFAAGLPVITFHPIAGHGKDNARYMSGSGVSRYAHDDAELQGRARGGDGPGPRPHRHDRRRQGAVRRRPGRRRRRARVEDQGPTRWSSRSRSRSTAGA